jgi:hypothetical protein
VTPPPRLFLFFCFNAQGAKGDRLDTLAAHLQYYPLIFVLGWAVSTVIRVVQACYPEHKDDFSFVFVFVALRG